jgi:hypothetical protein
MDALHFSTMQIVAILAKIGTVESLLKMEVILEQLRPGRRGPS